MENLKFALLTLIVISERTEESLEDGVITWGEGIRLGYSTIGLVKVFKTLKLIIAEYKDLTENGKQELAIWFRNEFDLENDNLEAMIEEIFESLINMSDLFDTLSKLK